MLKERYMVLRVYKRLNALDVYKKVRISDDYTYPEDFWRELIREEKVAIIRYFIEDLLQWDEQKLLDNLDNSVFYEYGLKKLLVIHYKDHFFNAIRDAYPTRFMPWQFKNNTIKKWDIKTAKYATRWLVEAELHLSTGKIYTSLKEKDFANANLDGMLKKVYGGSIPKAVQMAFPEKNIKESLFITPTNKF